MALCKIGSGGKLLRLNLAVVAGLLMPTFNLRLKKRRMDCDPGCGKTSLIQATVDVDSWLSRCFAILLSRPSAISSLMENMMTPSNWLGISDAGEAPCAIVLIGFEMQLSRQFADYHTLKHDRIRM